MNKTLSTIGLCARARKLSAGAQLSCDAIRGGKAVAVFLCADASENTKKKVRNCSTYYGTELIELSLRSEELGRAIGKAGAISCIAVYDAGLAEVIKDSNDRPNGR